MSVRAAVIDRFGEPDELRIADVEMPPLARLRVAIAEALPLEEVAAAPRRLSSGGMQDKLVLQVRS